MPQCSNICRLSFTSNGISCAFMEKYLWSIEFLSHWRNGLAALGLFNWKLATVNIRHRNSCTVFTRLLQVKLYTVLDIIVRTK